MRLEKTERVPPKHISVDEPLVEVTIRGRLRSGTGVVFGLLGGAVVAGLLFVTVSPRAEANPRNAVVVLLGTGLFLCLSTAALVARQERLAIRGDKIVHEKSLAGICWTRRQMDRSSVDVLRVQTRGAGGHGLAIIGREGRLLVGSSLVESDLEWLRAWLDARLS